MAKITFISHGKQITIIDNGDNKLGDGDSVRIGDSAPKDIADPALAEELRKAGAELANLRGSGTRIDALARFFRAVEKIRTQGPGEWGGKRRTS